MEPELGPDGYRAAAALLPPLTAALTLLPNLMPSIVMVGKKKHRGKNKRMPKAANHGARPCNSTGRRWRRNRRTRPPHGS